MINLRRLCVLSTSALLACSGSGFEDAGGGGGEGADVGGADPGSGEFHVVHIPTEDACGVASSETSRVQVFEVQVAKDRKSFTLSNQDDLSSRCAVATDGTFTCEAMEDELDGDDQTKVIASARYSGTWLTGDRFEGASKLEISCTGPDCADFDADLAGPLPCSSSAAFLGFRTLPENFAPHIGSYEATVAQTLSTCDGDFAAPENQQLEIVSQDGQTAQVSADDGQGVPHSCTFEGKGHTFCTRNLAQMRGVAGEDSLQSTSFADLAWTGANTFSGSAFQMVSCADGADCSTSKLGPLPCVAFYMINAGSPD